MTKMGITSGTERGQTGGGFRVKRKCATPRHVAYFMAQNLAPCLIGAKSVQICTKPEILRG